MEQSIQNTLFKDVVSVLDKYSVDFTEDSVMRIVRDWCLQQVLPALFTAKAS